MFHNWNYPSNTAHTVPVDGTDVHGAVFSPLTFRGGYRRTLIDCGPVSDGAALDTVLAGLCDLSANDRGAGWFAITRPDAQRFGSGADQFLTEVERDHETWSKYVQVNGIGAWLAPANGVDAPGIEAVAFTGEPEQADQLVSGHRVAIIHRQSLRAIALDVDFDVRVRGSSSWEPAHLVVYPTDPGPHAPVETLTADGDRAEVVLQNPVRVAADVDGIYGQADDADRAEALETLFSCETIRGHGPADADAYTIDRYVLTSLDAMNETRYPLWNVAVYLDAADDTTGETVATSADQPASSE